MKSEQKKIWNHGGSDGSIDYGEFVVDRTHGRSERIGIFLSLALFAVLCFCSV